MTQRVTFTQRAKTSCRRRGIDEDEASYVLDHARAHRDRPDPKTGTVYQYSLGQLEDGRWIEVMSEQLSDTVRIWRAIEVPDPSTWV